MAVWTHGRWTVTPGREEEFLAALRRVVAEVGSEVDMPAPVVLRDRDRSNHFLTFARWESLEAIERFRELALPSLEAMRDELLDDLEIFTFDEVEAGG